MGVQSVEFNGNDCVQTTIDHKRFGATEAAPLSTHYPSTPFLIFDNLEGDGEVSVYLEDYWYY